MRKHTANYAHTNSNFVIQNLAPNRENYDLLPILAVVKNLLQRGFPTIMSKYLQSEIGEIHKFENFNDRLIFATKEKSIWNKTIKGDKERNYYPAKEFLEEIVPTEFGEYCFIQPLIIPEIEITEILGEENQEFIYQQVDFYLPQAKLVIEIDGKQHQLDDTINHSDKKREKLLRKKDIETIRISTEELQNGSYSKKIEEIIKHLKKHESLLKHYRKSYETLENNQKNSEIFKTKILPTAIIRFQILLLDLLTYNYLTLDKKWSFNILCHENLQNFADLAVNDLLIWIDNLWQLKYKQKMNKIEIDIQIANNENDFTVTTKAINIDFSLYKRYTDKNTLNKNVIFVRTDYFDAITGKNYFKVNTTDPINYNIVEEDKVILEFFLDNIFDKTTFKEGQFSIISNILNRKDTIGLLPTGGGKSLCYQLPCLLQPSINFVVCPIKSLMYDQKDNLAKILVTNVESITSDSEKKKEIEIDFEQGKYLFVWISPEKLQIPSFREKICSIIAKRSISYAIVDEVHCLSEWGHDFRPSYLNLAKTIDALSPKDGNNEGTIKFVGLTATASVNVLKDIKIEFSRQKAHIDDENIKSLLDYSRKELQFEVIDDKGSKERNLIKLLGELKKTEGFLETDAKAGLIFTPYVNGAFGCYDVAEKLKITICKNASWFSGECPTAKKEKIETQDGLKENKKQVQKIPIMDDDNFKKHKIEAQDRFKKNKYQLLVSTKAFGMGIDKQNIFYTFHYGIPSSVEALYQEAGRAGRWNKSNKKYQNEIAKCYILFSPDTQNGDKVERIFNKDTTFAEINEILKKIDSRNKTDVFRQFFLLGKEQNDIEKEYELIQTVIKLYYKENTKVKIKWKDKNLKNINLEKDALQKIIYRLSLLGIVADWTTDFVNHYEVQFNSDDDKTIVENVSRYIAKYEPNTDIISEINDVKQDTLKEKSIWYLLRWIFEHITYNRKQSLKTLYELCLGYKNSETFKKEIDAYFKITETTFIIQYITEHPEEYEKWFEVLTNNNQYLNKAEFEKLKGNISRFLESYRNNIGLNFLSGYVRLSLNEYNDNDGRDRFESTLEHIKKHFSETNKTEFLNRLKILGKYFASEEQKIELCKSVSKFHPEELESFAEYYDLAYLLNNAYLERLQDLKKLNIKLYEQLRKI